ncbi:MAG TPA: N-acetylneuraminate synthase family protein [Bryobacteraceae bacterium]|nr:N-acetylneuraminate synthase family protein [Bryobacteraceae bacterium]
MEHLIIDGRRIGPSEPPYIIAEIGSNHNGDLSLAKRLVAAAKDCGADAVKFQSWSTESLISAAEYERNTRYIGDTGGLTLEQQVRRYELSCSQHYEIASYCRELDVTFFSSCFSRREADMLDSLGVPAFKIASMDVNHLPLLEYVARKGKPVILSSGLATLGEIERALDVLGTRGADSVAVLHCVSIYPSPPETIDLLNIPTLRAAFNVPVGYSDHSLGNAVPLAAVALGACIIEKHFTLDKRMDGWDHGISADPNDLAQLVQDSRAVFAALGSPVRTVRPEQLEKRRSFRRRMVVTRALPAGELLLPEDVEFKRPGTGIGPDELPYAAGRPLKRDLQAEDEVEWADLG